MGVPKFFRWLAERYPKIIQRNGSLPEDETYGRYFDPNDTGVKEPPPPFEHPDRIATISTTPPIDRLYIDMNGVIHGCSHSNDHDENDDVAGPASASITHEEIFRNVCYYLDRIVNDIAKPDQLVYMAIDGVAPRAKLNQQRSRRYRSGQEGDIEQTLYQSHEQETLERKKNKKKRKGKGKTKKKGKQADDDTDDDNVAGTNDLNDEFESYYGDALDPELEDDVTSTKTTSSNDGTLEELEDGRYQGKFMTEFEIPNLEDDKFHSNAITPGTPFFQEFTTHIEHYCQYKLNNDPKWKNLTIIFSGPNVPGEGEHKIMDFIREQKARPNYNPNLRHCIMGQDGDLMMLGLATHEPNLILLRERVIFDMTKKDLMHASNTDPLDLYLHNPHFELLHLSVLRDYLAYEFGTSNVESSSPYDLERTIDDFVFMTFFVGNDFLPHMPAIDIGDHAFDLIFQTYKDCRREWLEDDLGLEPYLTDSGNIASGSRLEQFLSELGSHEVPYYGKKQLSANSDNKRMRRQGKRFGHPDTIPTNSLMDSKEKSDRHAYRRMLQSETSKLENTDNDAKQYDANFMPVVAQFAASEDDSKEDKDIFTRMGNLLNDSISSKSNRKELLRELDDTDVKGRYYFDKFQFSPFDVDSHRALRKAYIEGLVWTLKYYYEGCVSWEWYYPYHYGPMLSDLVEIDDMLDEISFEGKMGKPLEPFQQLLGCMPPSHAYHLPGPYRPLMTDPQSPILEFYPKKFLIDMNGKRWPWEAVVLLPFIDSKRLIAASQEIDASQLTDAERARNAPGETIVMRHDIRGSAPLPSLVGNDGPVHFQAIPKNDVSRTPYEESSWYLEGGAKQVLKPKLEDGIEYPLPGYGSLQVAPVRRLKCSQMGLNVFGTRSRYKLACLAVDGTPMSEYESAEELAKSLVGNIVHINYPHFIEAWVTAVCDAKMEVRGKQATIKRRSPEESAQWRIRRDGILRTMLAGESVTGSGGISITGEQPATVLARPLLKIDKTKKKGKLVKRYADFEVEVPLACIDWKPVHTDRKFNKLPKIIEKNAYTRAQKSVLKKYEATVEPLLPPMGTKASDDFLAIDWDEMDLDTEIESDHENEGDEDEGDEGEGDDDDDDVDIGMEFDAITLPDGVVSIDTIDDSDDDDDFDPENNEDGAVSGEATHTQTAKEGSSFSSDDSSLGGTVGGSIRSMSTWAGGYSASRRWRGGMSPHLTPLRRSQAFLKRNDRWAVAPNHVSRSMHTRIGLVGQHRNHSACTGRMMRSAGGRKSLLAAGAMAAAFLFGSTSADPLALSGAATKRWTASRPMRNLRSILQPEPLPTLDDMLHIDDAVPHSRIDLRGGDIPASSFLPSRPTPPLEFAHGTTTLSFTFDGGILVAVDSRASMGSFVSSKTVEKVLPINSHILGTMAGGAADCLFWIRKIQSEALLHELCENGRRMSVARASRLLSNALYINRSLGLSVGTMIMGFDDDGSGADTAARRRRLLPRIFYVDNTGVRIEGDMFSAGSGSTFALGILDTERRPDMKKEEAVALGIKAIRHATFRDAYSGGFINVYVLTQDDGWQKVFSEDLASHQHQQQHTAAGGVTNASSAMEDAEAGPKRGSGEGTHEHDGQDL